MMKLVMLGAVLFGLAACGWDFTGGFAPIDCRARGSVACNRAGDPGHNPRVDISPRPLQ
jgi:hypothetical protein